MKTITINGNIATDRIIKESCTSAKLLGSPIEDIFKYLVQWFPRKGVEPPKPRAEEIAKKYAYFVDPNKEKELAQEIEAYRTADPLNKQWTLFKEQLEDREVELERTMQQLKAKLDELNKPPTLRPMSELSEGARKVNLLTGLNGTAGHEEWKIGYLESIKKCITGTQVFYLSTKRGVFADGYGEIILGWLPLPKPDEIKLPC